MDKIRTRIAPSPTGFLHVGTARAALFNELFTRNKKGVFVLRIEDTDKERSKFEFEQNILSGLKWLGLKWDEGPDVGGPYGPYRQSERGELYKKALSTLIDSGKAYKDEASEAIRLKVEPQEVIFTDLIRGEVKVHSDSWGGDYIIARSINNPLYHLAVVVDDHTMRISHVIRGEDHLTNTARQILLLEALNYSRPYYAHLPLLLDSNRKKLSKRSGDTNLLDYREDGFLPQTMLNYLALLGWNPGNDQEIFSHQQLMGQFDLAKVQKGGAIFDRQKLESINKHYLTQLSNQDLLLWGRTYLKAEPKRAKLFAQVPDERLTKGLATEQERISSYHNLDELLDWIRDDWPADYQRALLVWKKSTPSQTVAYLNALSAKLSELKNTDFTTENLSTILLSWIKENEWGNGDVLWPMRVALTGREHSPGPFEVAATLGQLLSINRIKQAAANLKHEIPDS